jgi:hypothetical protein
MSDTFTEQEPQEENPNLKQLREKAKLADELQARLDEAEAKNAINDRRNAFAESGIDVTKGPGRLLLDAYKGENTPEAIKAAAAEYGIPLVTEEVNELPDTGTEVRQELADNAGADTGETPDPNQVAMENFKADMAAGRSEEAGAGTFIATLAKAAHEGDPRAIWVEPASR